jgi:hypothetical protein
VTRGKWMCFPVPHAVDVLWDDLALALAAGALDPATEIKVAPRYDTLRFDCIACANFCVLIAVWHGSAIPYSVC